MCVCVCELVLCASLRRKIYSYSIHIPELAQTAGTGGEQHLTFTTVVPHRHANMLVKHQLSHNLVIIEKQPPSVKKHFVSLKTPLHDENYPLRSRGG